MIKANELRIGNWVSFFNPISGKIEYRQVTARFFSSLAGGRSESEMSPDEELNNYWQPIPLTPEILEKCGFELNKERTKWRRGHIELLVNFNGYDYFFGGFSKIKYLHQLQNLIYCLTGDELNVNL